MSFETGLFWVFAAMLLFAAFRVVTVKNPVHAALFLVLTFACSSVLWMLLEAEFLAIALVLVYVGAVMVLFLFVVMMLDINIVPLREGFIRYLPVGILIAAVLATVMWQVLHSGPFNADAVAMPVGKPADYSNTQELGRVLYTEYLYPFEIAGALLLVAIIAAIALTMRRRPETKYQDPATQMKVKKSDRLRIVKMEAEKK
ncbi:MAG TPA: NADH-quinone oxidoreductase subunit J [Gammaproteobacteria bacterium]|nr:NADH-quinone oxidoreductase subunit J [Gammaproteobacteria bacterium]